MQRILIIEDHADVRRLLRWALEPDGHRIFEATNGQTGLDKMREIEPDLILLDVMMPGALDGYHVCERIRADPNFQRLPVIMISARATDNDRQAAARAGANEFIAKPFSPATLSSHVNKLLTRRAAPTEITTGPASAVKSAKGSAIDATSKASTRLGGRVISARRNHDASVAVETSPSGSSHLSRAVDGGNSQLIHCIYTSEVNQELDEQGLASLLQSVREKNERLGLSGILLMAGSDFFQVLEGPSNVVDETFAKIKGDLRHRRVTKIVRESIPNRFFEDWTMGFSKFTNEDLAMVLGVNDFFSGGRCLAELNQGRAKGLLEAFRDGRWRQSLAGRRKMS